MDDSESSGSTSTGTRAKSAKKRTLPYKVTATKIEDVKYLTIGHLRLEKPSNLTHVPASQQNVCLYTLAATDEFSLHILREIYHENILHSEAVISSSSTSINLCVENYTHNLDIQLRNVFDNTHISELHLIQQVQSYLRQVIDGVDELRLNGVYHGNLNLANSYVDRDPNNGAVVVKLANFKEKEGNELLKSQFEDWNAVGDMVIKISNKLQRDNPNIDVSVMNDLGAFLKNLPPNLLIHEVKGKALNQVFFWDKSRRTSFFVSGILVALDSVDFIRRVSQLDFIPKDWILDDHDGILTAMNKGRVSKYSGGRYEYVKFVSGAYSHEGELKDEQKLSLQVIVDDVISKKQPRLCLELVRIIREIGFDV